MHLQRRRVAVALVGAALGATALVVAVRVEWHARELAGQRAAIVEALDATPGLLVLGTDERSGAWRIRGLADPAARPPAEVAAAVDPTRGVAGLVLEFAPFEAPGAAFTEARLSRRLTPPPGVELKVDDDGAVRLSGTASSPWIARARAVVPAVTGVTALDDSGLVDTDLRHLVELVAELDGLALRFPLGRADLGGALVEADPRGSVVAARARIAELGRAAARAGALVRVELVPGRHVHEAVDPDLALRRMALVRALLAPGPGAPLLFELRLVTAGALEVADSGAVRLSLQVLGPLLGAQSAASTSRQE